MPRSAVIVSPQVASRSVTSRSESSTRCAPTSPERTLARVASERKVADDFAVFAHHEVVVLVVVRLHGCERRLLARNRDPFIFVTEADELGDATHGSFVVVLHVFVREQQHVRVVTMRPPRSEVRVVRA